ncbi:MAG: type III pantothenate kinase [Acidobacteriota bacterium]|nr:type III pantothenate kinase [Acidobacteriota bacterium]
MLLVLDIGNTETELGLFPLREDSTAAPELMAQWRISTARQQTVDEHGVLIRQLFSLQGIDPNGVHGIIVSSVVPPMDTTVRQMCERYFNRKALFIEPGIKTGMPVHYDNPAEVGADRIVNAVAAYERCKTACIVVDFGTATTFDAVSAKGEYLGGVIAPGIGISADALFERTARLPRVDLKRPPHVVGSNTVHSLQSGLFYGYVGLVDGVLDRLLGEVGPAKVIATGAMAVFLAAGSRYLDEIHDGLTLEGLRIIWDRNVHARRK